MTENTYEDYVRAVQRLDGVPGLAEEELRRARQDRTDAADQEQALQEQAAATQQQLRGEVVAMMTQARKQLAAVGAPDALPERLGPGPQSAGLASAQAAARRLNALLSAELSRRAAARAVPPRRPAPVGAFSVVGAFVLVGLWIWAPALLPIAVGVVVLLVAVWLLRRRTRHRQPSTPQRHRPHP